LKPFFSFPLLWITAYILDLNFDALDRMRKEDYDQYLLVEDSLLLAGMWLFLNEEFDRHTSK
jgi:hypothetical protein